MGKIRFFIALWVGKAARIGMRLLGRKATFLPGLIALKVCPDFLALVGKPETLISITGTNGKTTVVNLVCDIFERTGKKVLHNKYGSNVDAGIASALMLGCGIFGKSRYDVAVFETDERSVRRIYPYVVPSHIVITNLFRDSIMRNGHPEYIADFLQSAIPPTSKLILNADDLISCRISPENQRVYFGIERMESDLTESINLINDMRICPVCHGKLEYDYLRYHHIGKAHCRDCDFRAPEYDYAAKEVNLETMTMTASDKGGSGEYRLINDSIFNIYNMITVIALLRELGMAHGEISAAMEKTGIVTTRYREDREGDISVVMQLAKEKNAPAIARAFDYVSGQSGQKQLLLMMNCLNDAKNWSENTCWMYDCDFELLNRPDITRIIVSGPRAKDLYLRCLFAGIPREKLICEEEEEVTPDLFDYEEKSNIYIFHGVDSYDVALVVREKIAGYARAAAEAAV